MKVKYSKSRSISITKDKLSEGVFLKQRVTYTVAENPVKSFGRWYNATLKDTDQVGQLRKDNINGLESINKSLLPGRLKLWCLQLGLLSRLMWLPSVNNVPISKVNRMERLVSSIAKKLLGFLS